MLKGRSPRAPIAGPTYLWVAAEDEVDARAISRRFESGAYALVDDAGVTRFETGDEVRDLALRETGGSRVDLPPVRLPLPDALDTLCS